MGENRKIYAALLGAGTVGSGVYKLAGMQEEDICLKTGASFPFTINLNVPRKIAS